MSKRRALSAARTAATALAPTLAQSIQQAIVPDGEALAAAHSFAEQAAADATADELPELSADQLAANLADFWRFGDRRRARTPLVRVASALGAAEPGLDRLEIIQDDCRFLVDSVMGEVADQGLAVRAMFHPIVEVRRDRAGARATTGTPRRESMIQVVLAPVGADREAALAEGIAATLSDVHAAVDDFPKMLALMQRTIDELSERPGKATPEEFEFLRWLEAERFVFLGARIYEFPRLDNGDYAPEEPLYQPKDGLGVLRDPARTVLRRANEPAILAKKAKDRIFRETAVTVAKANSKSRVHRRGYLDYVGVKRYDDEGRPYGEVRFVGLFTAEAYDQAVTAVPLLREKVARVLSRAGAAPGGHSENRLKNILENHPRDELFQVGEDELLDQALGILHLYDRPRVGLFERRDPLDRFASVLLFLPRDQYDSELERRAGQMLAQAYGGRVSAAYPIVLDAPLARVHYVIGFSPGAHPWPDLKALEQDIAEAARSWRDRFEAAVRAKRQRPAEVAATLARYRDAFPAGYQDRFDAAEALADLELIEAMGDAPVRARAYRLPGDGPTQFHFKLYRPGAPIPLAEVLPILENMGLKAMAEAGFPITRARASGGSNETPDAHESLKLDHSLPRTGPPFDGEGSNEPPVWVHDFEIDDERGEHLVFSEVKPAFEEAVAAVWTGQTENDGFNRLVLELSVPWRDAALVRALARYRQQSGLDPTQRTQEEALANNPGVARLILDLFRTRFDPAIRADLAARGVQDEAVMAEILSALQHVDSLEEDRVLRRLAQLVRAIQRTNYYQQGADGRPKPYISFKVASGELADLPAPKPFREIFVWAVNVEGVHLRFGPVARGGLRWSDRRDDFRTEVLGLAKAQQVKNAVIVPVGSKGGFYPKRLPKGGTPEAVRAEAICAYRTFLCGLLDLTDNLTPEGRVAHPPGVVVHDGDDPYLVVAADKGTATFSDIANAVAESYGFWLGDAFASGGSAGYDHKEMGITARGAWEAVKRHFRELGKDIQTEPFTVIGVGDMSGDVFGNGMLLSEQTRLIAAFDHRHIFIDPDADPARSFAERKRMFALPRSSWADYDRQAISEGGGVYARSLKAITLSPRAQAALDVKHAELSPAELITAILKAPAELLYMGGIGTYVKAAREANVDVGDKANDGVRVNAGDLRVKVVGEGANLGVTQAGRIEYAQAGGRIDTDAIDNSAGVDSSDHEVNIKILTGMLERSGQLTRRRRDTLLRSMTKDVAAHVLAHNYGQTLALSLMEMDAAGELEPYAQFIARLEAEGRLDRAVESLPGPAEIGARAAAGQGLTRPELAVLLAYGKLELKREMTAAGAVDDPWLEGRLEAYFPKPLRRRGETIRRHRLRPDIIATVVANDVVDRCGPSFPWRLMNAANCDVAAFVAGYEAAKIVLDVDVLWDEVSALDDRAPSTGQMALYRRIASALRGGAFWLARRAARDKATVQTLVDRYCDDFRQLRALTPEIASPVEREAIEARTRGLVDAGAPEHLARAAAVLQAISTAADLVDLAEGAEWPLKSAARLYHAVGEAFAFDRLRAAAAAFAVGDNYERTALRRLIEELLAEQTSLTRAVIARADAKKAAEAEGARAAVHAWCAPRADQVAAARRTLEEIEAAPGGWTFAKLTIANAALRELALAGEARRRR
ncbi:MAG TPA: NAD-glutamate dehydrogenase [Phenylobacterium sp.]|uniref:NAD-glutamate dehydrogenase n=1 Tax=Phenylobacterium sp. TaxID=1871053 RepID=UPI002B4820F4|nr:NAD-glutamate dehydrogenase [Phenylobacterium sp.]HKR90588.1 NAD-glutamate dehydrogenase [Phenylobacterium sp.]